MSKTSNAGAIALLAGAAVLAAPPALAQQHHGGGGGGGYQGGGSFQGGGGAVRSAPSMGGEFRGPAGGGFRGPSGGGGGFRAAPGGGFRGPTGGGLQGTPSPRGGGQADASHFGGRDHGGWHGGDGHDHGGGHGGDGDDHDWHGGGWRGGGWGWGGGYGGYGGSYYGGGYYSDPFFWGGLGLIGGYALASPAYGYAYDSVDDYDYSDAGGYGDRGSPPPRYDQGANSTYRDGAAPPGYDCDGWRWDANARRYVAAKVSCQ